MSMVMDRLAGGKGRKKKLIETEREKEKRGAFTTEMALPRICLPAQPARKMSLVDRRGMRLIPIEVQTH